MTRYERQQIWMLIDINDAVGEAAIKTNCKPCEVFITIAFVSHKLGISRYHAKKLMEQLTHIGIFGRRGNRYVYNTENLLMMSLCSMATGY